MAHRFSKQGHARRRGAFHRKGKGKQKPKRVFPKGDSNWICLQHIQLLRPPPPQKKNIAGRTTRPLKYSKPEEQVAEVLTFSTSLGYKLQKHHPQQVWFSNLQKVFFQLCKWGGEMQLPPGEALPCPEAAGMGKVVQDQECLLLRTRSSDRGTFPTQCSTSGGLCFHPKV